jgi:hypothetical protein
MTKTLALFVVSTGILMLGGTVAAAGIGLVLCWALIKEDEA